MEIGQTHVLLQNFFEFQEHFVVFCCVTFKVLYLIAAPLISIANLRNV